MTGRPLTPCFITWTVYGALLLQIVSRTTKTQSLKKFNSDFWCPGTLQVGAFAIRWGNDNNYLVPPMYLVTKAIKHLQSSKGQGTLVVPFWPSASFWPFLQSYPSKEFNSYVVDFKVSTQPHQCFQLGNNKSSLIGSNKFKSQILACSLHFRETKYCNLSTVFCLYQPPAYE